MVFMAKAAIIRLMLFLETTMGLGYVANGPYAIPHFITQNMKKVKFNKDVNY